ncbi:MAG: shikimate dehydrogenase [Balneolales bacterium]
MPALLHQLMNLQSPFCLVIGNPIAHSLSPLLHNTASDYHQLALRYYALNIDLKDFGALPALFDHNNFTGANITIPYKTKIRSFLHHEDETAGKVGAVNTICKDGDSLTGYNTDVYGFSEPLRAYRNLLTGSKAVVFGSGGASKAVVYGLISLGLAEVAVVSRDPAGAASRYAGFGGPVTFHSYADLSPVSADAILFVNTTPLGMEPDIHRSPVPPGMEYVLRDKICYDIVYKPLNTFYLHQAKEQGADVIKGLDMFVYQGARAFELWTGKTLPFDLVKKKILDVLQLTA